MKPDKKGILYPSNQDKIKDRNPIICPAGKLSWDPELTVGNCLKDYRLADQVDAVKHEYGIWKEPPFKYKLPPLKNYRNSGIYTESRPTIRPEVLTRFQRLINDLKETVYESYWNQVEGKCRDPVPGLPPGMDIYATTFGKLTERSSPVYELMHPPKGRYQVLWDSQVGHDMYKKTHDDYNPGEQVDRKYPQPPFNPDYRFGKPTWYDKRGLGLKCATHWVNNEPITHRYKIQAETHERQDKRIGKVYAPCKNIESVKRGHMFGKPSTRAVYGVAELLKDADCPPCIFKRDFHTWMSYLNQLRKHIKKRFNTFGFDLKEFRNHCLFYDKEHTGWIPTDLFYALCECHDLHYQYKCLEPLFNFIEVIKDDKINYNDFTFLADINSSVPMLIDIDEIPKKNQYYKSETHDANCDFLRMDNSKFPPAGVQSRRFDLPFPRAPPGGLKVDIDNLGDETTAKGIVSPCIYANYGLTYMDFFLPRQPEQIKRIFENIGYAFPDDTFDKLWKIGLERDKTGLVCVDTFKKLVKETIPPPTFIIKEDDECKQQPHE